MIAEPIILDVIIEGAIELKPYINGCIIGPPGADGSDGDSAYQIAVDNGFVGTEQDWLDSLVGVNGADGKDAYESYLETTSDNPVLTEAQWSASFEIDWATNSDMSQGTSTTVAVNPLQFNYGFGYNALNINFDDLDTTDETIIGAINEVHSELGQIPDSYVTYTKVATDLKSTIELTGTEINFTTHKGLRKVITGDTTFTVSNLIENKGVNLSLSGNHAVAFTGCTCIGGAYDGAVENFIQLVCARNSANTLVVYYSFNQPI